MKLIRILSNTLLVLCSLGVFGQNNLLQSGPMVGYSEMKEVMLWAQTSGEGSVYFEYWEKSNPAKKYRTDLSNATKENSFVIKSIVCQVEPGKEYDYKLFINNEPVERPYPLSFRTQPLFQWRSDPPEFSFALGSCNYVNDSLYDRPGKPYGAGYGIFESIRQKKPAFMIWVGDNVYLRETDWTTRTGILNRYTHTRSLSELQPLLGSVHHYATWDDHDYGSNDSDRSFMSKDLTTEAFKLFWANQRYGGKNSEGIYSTFTYNDVQFFLLDNRTFRSPNKRTTGERDYFGKAQLEWLVDGLSSSQASFKIIISGGQILNPATVYENYSNYPEEKALLLKAIQDEKINGVLFMSGDRHHTELTKLSRDNSFYPLYDLTVSPLTSGVYAPKKEENSMQVGGTFVSERNYGLIKVSGKKGERILTITIYNESGKEMWTKDVSENSLK